MLTSSLPPTAQAIQALVSRFTQASRVLRLHTPLGEDVLLAESLHGEEAIDTGFRLRVSALSTDAALPLKALLGQPVLLELLAGPFQGVRPFHGHVTAAEMMGANGGLARYVLTIEPWTAFLALGRDSRVFQNKTIVDIIDAVLSAYDGKGRLAPAWRFQVDRSLYPQRSLATQYQESDLAFVRRLMSEEGLFAFFEHEGDPAGVALGTHTLVIADSNDAFRPNTQAVVRYTQPGAVMVEDSIDRWRTETRLATNAIELRSWDYRARQVRAVGAAAQDAVELAGCDIPGVYAYTSREHGARIAERQLQALEAGRIVHVGAGTVRTFTPGTTFTLAAHGAYDGASDPFLLVRVRHLAHNNLDAETASTLVRHLGHDPVAALNEEVLAASLHAGGKRIAERPVYRNSFDAIPGAPPYRDSRVHPKPTVSGQQTAIVVGPPGAAIRTDRDHRIKVQFHWQRGAASHSRLDHPEPLGHTGAPADDRAGTWVRVATPLAPVAGANWGSHALPRVGQEVLIDFLDGNIDRPVVIGAVYNGAGAADAQHNTVTAGPGAATGNAGAWFPGVAGAHAHAAVLSGLKSQAMQSSASGIGAYSQLVFDDTPGQARVALQRHAQAHRGTAELNLGHLVHQADNRRMGTTGLGVELKTEYAGALRAGTGLLLTTDRTSDHVAQLEASPAANQIEQAVQLQTTQATTAQQHNAKLPQESEAEKLPALKATARSAKAIKTSVASTFGNNQSHTTVFSEPHLQLSTPSGIAALTPASTVISAGGTSALTAGQDLNFAAQGGWHHSAKSGISLFTYGKAGTNSRPAHETGIRLHAAAGKVSTQSQSSATRITADKLITVASITQSVDVAAKEHVLLTAQGAYIKLLGGDIQLHGPGRIEFKASMKEFAGPMQSQVPKLTFPSSIVHFKVKKGYPFSR